MSDHVPDAPKLPEGSWVGIAQSSDEVKFFEGDVVPDCFEVRAWNGTQEYRWVKGLGTSRTPNSEHADLKAVCTVRYLIGTVSKTGTSEDSNESSSWVTMQSSRTKSYEVPFSPGAKVNDRLAFHVHELVEYGDDGNAIVIDEVILGIVVPPFSCPLAETLESHHVD